jgi:hypothetical protein
MSTPLGLVKRMKLAFPEFVDIRIVREGPYRLRTFCELATNAAPVAQPRLDEWMNRNRVAGSVVAVDQVVVMPEELDDDTALLQRTTLRRIVVEEANVTGDGLRKGLCEHFPGEVVDVGDSVGKIIVHVGSDLAVEREQPIIDATRLLLPCDPVGIEIERRSSSRPAIMAAPESTTTYQRLAEDTAFLHEHLPNVLGDQPIPFAQSLPDGASTYASPHDGVQSLMHRLALFERVYVYLPLKRGDFPQWVGNSIDEFLASLPTGRVVPVFGHKLDRYDAGLVSAVLDAGAPRVVLHGEYALRTIKSFCSEHRILSLIGTDAGAQLRRELATENDESVAPFRGYVEAIADIAERLGYVTINGPALAVAWDPLAQWLDATVQHFGLPSRALELCTAIEYRAIAESFDSVPVSQLGHYLDGYLRFIYGALQGDTDVLRIPDPTLIARICFPDTTGLSVEEFARTFVGPRVEAMRALMATRRVQTADSCDDMVRAFNEELSQYARRAGDGYTAVGVLLGVAGLVGGLGVPALLAGLSLELAKRVLARNSPSMFATLTARLTGTTREGALLARITKA